MAATGTAVPLRERAGDPRPPRRPLRTRLSAGHVVMVVAGLVAVVLNYSLLQAADSRVRVAVAARPLASGEPVPVGAVRFVDVGADDVVVDALVGPDDLEVLDGSVAAVAVAAGDLLRRSDLRPASAPDGRRAMSVPVPAEHAVAGQLERGDRVDVIEVRDGRASYVLTDAEVLAVSGGDGSGLAGLGTFSVTVAVDADSALRVAEAIRADAVEVVRTTGANPAGAGAHATPSADSRSAAEDDAGDGDRAGTADEPGR